MRHSSLALDIYTWLAHRLCRINIQKGVASKLEGHSSDITDSFGFHLKERALPMGGEDHKLPATGEPQVLKVGQACSFLAGPGELRNPKRFDGSWMPSYNDEQADSLILRAFERGYIGFRELPKVLRKWRNPAYPEFQPRTVYSLLNAFTSGLKERAVRQPAEYAKQKMRLHGLLDRSDSASQHLHHLTA